MVFIDGSAAYSMQMIPNTSYGKITVNTAGNTLCVWNGTSSVVTCSCRVITKVPMVILYTDSVLMTQNMSYGDLDIRNIAVTGISAKGNLIRKCRIWGVYLIGLQTIAAQLIL